MAIAVSATAASAAARTAALPGCPDTVTLSSWLSARCRRGYTRESRRFQIRKCDSGARPSVDDAHLATPVPESLDGGRVRGAPGEHEVDVLDRAQPGELDRADLAAVREHDAPPGGRDHPLLDLRLGQVDVRDA